MKLDCTNIIIIILLIYIIFGQTREYFTSSFVESDTDKRKYKVINSFHDKDDAANTMSEINKFIFAYLKYVRNKFVIKKQGTITEINFVKRMLKNYNPDTIFENNPKNGEDTSFVVNKGKKFGICLRGKKTNKGKIHDMNTIKFVILHELSHLGTISYGHKYEFWSFFKFNIIQAYEAGLYYPVNYMNNPINYCGLDIIYSPYYNPRYDWNKL